MKFLFWPVGTTTPAEASPVVGRLTVRQLIIDALLEIGAYDPVDALEPEDGDTGLRAVQRMVDAFQSQRIYLFAEKTFPFALTAHQATNTLGPGGDFDTDPLLGTNTPRPDRLAPGCTVTPVGDVLDYALEPYERRQDYLLEPDKTITDLWPQRMLYEPEWPLGKLTWWPVPTTAAVVTLAWPVPLTVPATLDTVLNFPPGYLDAWLYNLAKRLCHPYRRAITADLREDARAALAAIAKTNDPGPPPSRSDSALTDGGGYDIRSNSYR